MKKSEKFVKLKCECGSEFEREQFHFDKYENYKVKYPSASRFYKRKIDNCDECLHNKMLKSLKALPDLLVVLANGTEE
jgi:hypothetical protein